MNTIPEPVVWIALNMLVLVMSSMWRRTRLATRVAGVLWFIMASAILLEFISKQEPTAIVMADTPMRSAIIHSHPWFKMSGSRVVLQLKFSKYSQTDTDSIK